MNATLIYLIACHGAPAAHFGEFAKALVQKGCRVEILATGPALDKLRNAGAKECNSEKENIDDFEVQKRLAEKIAKSLEKNGICITDVGHPFMASVQEAVAKHAPRIHRFAYYENPEPFVPGGYSKTAAKVMSLAHKVLFANANLVKETLFTETGVPLPLSQEHRIGLGYYPYEAAKAMKEARAEGKERARQAFFAKYNIADTGQKILVYFGGNNEVYFEKAFPAFLQMLREAKIDPSQYLVLLQQHPGAKAKNIDRELSRGEPIFVSEMTSDEAQILADAALYYQTSMGPQFVLAGIPAIQVGHETYHDVLVRSHLAPSVTDSKALIDALDSMKPPQSTASLFKDLGIRSDWAEVLVAALKFRL